MRRHATVAVLMGAGMLAAAGPATAQAPAKGWKEVGSQAGNRYVWAVEATRDGSVFTSEQPPLAAQPRADLFRYSDGRKWRTLPRLPVSAGQRVGYFNDLEATSRNDLWVSVEIVEANPSQMPIGDAIYRWDGRKWQRKAFARDLNVQQLEVAADGRPWYIGLTGRKRVPILRRWDGKSWIGIPTKVRFSAFGPRTPKDVWALAGGTAYRWNGKKWRTQKLPKVTPEHSYETAYPAQVLVAGAKNVWLRVRILADYEETDAVLLRWNGRAWKRTALPGPSGALSGDGRGGVWFLTNASVLYHHTGTRLIGRKFPQPSTVPSLQRTLSSVSGVPGKPGTAIVGASLVDGGSTSPRHTFVYRFAS